MSTKMVTIASFENSTEAHAARNCLVAEGIAATVMDESVGSWLGYMGSAIGGIKLQVAEADAERSQEILMSQVDGDAGATGPWRCARCRENVDGGFEICWSCGGEREEFQDPNGVPDEASDDTPTEAALDDDLSTAPPSKGSDSPTKGHFNPYSAGRLPAEPIAAAGDAAQTASDEVEATVTRAWRSAILGIFICPSLLLVNVYSVWLLLKISFEPGELGPSGLWKYRMAWAINWLAILIMLAVLSLALRG